MARLNICEESGDELPELSVLLGMVALPNGEEQNKQRSPRKAQRAAENVGSYPALRISEQKSPTRDSKPPRRIVKASCNEEQIRKQKPLRPAHVNSLLLPVALSPSKPLGHEQNVPPCSSRRSTTARDTPRRIAARKVDFSIFATELDERLESAKEGESCDDLSDFIVSDSASEEELPIPKTTRKDGKKSPHKSQSRYERPKDSPETIDLISPVKNPQTVSISRQQEAPKTQTTSNVFEENPFSSLRFSPPRSKSRYKKTDSTTRFNTPPRSPSKPKLQSPSKSKPRVPPSPHRPSIDAFWSAAVINDWNDQYSPRKPPSTKRLFALHEEDESPPSPSASTRRSPTKSPSKKDKVALERKRLFDTEKHALASAFLEELDATIGNGQVAALAASTGGIHITWSNKLQSTAGRANWKREAIRATPPTSSSADPADPITNTMSSLAITSSTTTTATYRHHATIELASKVIDSPSRLLNVLAHEYCHLANFMLSGVKDQPHGASFKAWATKVSTAFGSRGVHVTTKHSYEIQYKYAWRCADCGVLFRRHSRSIDPRRVKCGSCKGPLVQVLPVPRAGAGTGGGGDGKGGGGYRGFVKENYGVVKKAQPGLGMGEIMQVLGRMYREGKEKEREKETQAEGGSGVELGRVIETVEGLDEDEDDGDLDTVARKLDFLSLRTDG